MLRKKEKKVKYSAIVEQYLKDQDKSLKSKCLTRAYKRIQH